MPIRRATEVVSTVDLQRPLIAVQTAAQDRRLRTDSRSWQVAVIRTNALSSRSPFSKFEFRSFQPREGQHRAECGGDFQNLRDLSAVSQVCIVLVENPQLSRPSASLW